MISSIKKFIKFLFLKLGYKLYRTDRVSKSEILFFINKIKPIKTQYSLIRIGSRFDGGYLIPNDLNGIEYCFSPGVNNNSDFEMDLYNNYNIISFLSDFSVDAPPINSDGLIFQKKFIGSNDSEVFITLENWVKKYETNGDLILQMDIEGYEYQVLAQANIDVLRRFRIIVIEFHQLDFLITDIGFKFISGIFDKLLEEFKIVHIHPNNGVSPINFEGLLLFPILEITFLRNDRISLTEKIDALPSILDSKNIVELPEYNIPKYYY